MASIRCNECGAQISNQFDPCPQCGAIHPAMPVELARLHQEFAVLEEEERRQQVLYQGYYAEIDEFPWLIFRLWRNLVLDRKVKKHTTLANQALFEKKKVKQEILELQKKLSEQD